MGDKDRGRPQGGPGSRASTEPQSVSAASGFDPSRVTDAQLAEACCPGESKADKTAFLAALSDDHRERLKRLIWTGDELNAGRTPPGVIVCRRTGRHA